MIASPRITSVPGMAAVSRSADAFRSRLHALSDLHWDVSQAMSDSLSRGTVSPYHTLKPWLQRAAGVGEPPIAPTPHRVVYARGQMKLLHYEPEVRRHRTPILFVYSLINRYYILDFLPGRSLIEFMRDQGFDRTSG